MYKLVAVVLALVAAALADTQVVKVGVPASGAYMTSLSGLSGLSAYPAGYSAAAYPAGYSAGAYPAGYTAAAAYPAGYTAAAAYPAYQQYQSHYPAGYNFAHQYPAAYNYQQYPQYQNFAQYPQYQGYQGLEVKSMPVSAYSAYPYNSQYVYQQKPLAAAATVTATPATYAA